MRKVSRNESIGILGGGWRCDTCGHWTHNMFDMSAHQSSYNLNPRNWFWNTHSGITWAWHK